MLNVLQRDMHGHDKYKPEKCQFAYEGELGSLFRFKADKLGNFSFRLQDDAASLGYIIELLRFFRENKATEDVMAWPWRGGASDSEDQNGVGGE